MTEITTKQPMTFMEAYANQTTVLFERETSRGDKIVVTLDGIDTVCCELHRSKRDVFDSSIAPGYLSIDELAQVLKAARAEERRRRKRMERFHRENPEWGRSR